MALFKSFIKKHRPSALSAAIGVTIVGAIAMSMTVGQVIAKDHFATAERTPTGFDSYLTSIHQIQTGAADDTDVRLKGRLTGYLYDNNYEFTDVYGQSIEVELDDDTDWSYVHKDQLIEILGEVERNMFKVKVEAKYYRILEEARPVVQMRSSDVATPTPVVLNDDAPASTINSQPQTSTINEQAQSRSFNDEPHNVSALSGMTSDAAVVNNASSNATMNGAASTSSQAINASQATADTASSANTVVIGTPTHSPSQSASISETNTTKNVSVLDKVVVSTTTTTVKTVSLSDGTKADASGAVSSSQQPNNLATQTIPNSDKHVSEGPKGQQPAENSDKSDAAAVVTASQTN